MKQTLFMLALVACGGKSDEPAGNPDLDEARAELHMLADKMSSGDDLYVSCLSARSAADRVGSLGAEGKTLATEIRRLCTHDIPIATLEKAFAKAERIEDPLDRIIPCNPTHLFMHVLAEFHADDPKTRVLQAKYDALCDPDAKSDGG